MLVNAECITKANIGDAQDCDEKNSAVNNAYFCLQKANRNADRNYISELLKVFHSTLEWHIYYLFLYGAGK